MKKINFKYILLRLCIILFCSSIFIVVMQDFLVFPGITIGEVINRGYKVPKDVMELPVETVDGETVFVWRREPPIPLVYNKKKIILLLHGNGDSARSFYNLQKWFSDAGFVAYTLEYRGFLGTTGWPSEKGIYLDGEAAINEILKRESATPKDLSIFAHSIGTGPAAYLAAKFQVKTLALISPYDNFRGLVHEMPWIGYLSPFLKYDFPTSEYISQLKETSLIVAHGKIDTTVPYWHGVETYSSYKGSGKRFLFLSDMASHNNVLHYLGSQVGAKISKLAREELPNPHNHQQSTFNISHNIPWQQANQSIILNSMHLISIIHSHSLTLQAIFSYRAYLTILTLIASEYCRTG